MQKNIPKKIFIGISILGENSIGPLIWQFVAFKIVIVAQVLFYRLSWESMKEFPVIYKYAYGVWVILDIIVGISLSILIYKLINKPVSLLASKVEKRFLEKKR